MAEVGYLDDLTVVELAGNPGVGFCGKLFASFGATVTRVVEPGTPEPSNNIDRAAAFYLDVDKRRLDAPFDSPAAREAIGRADVVVAGGIPPGLVDVLDIDGVRANPRGVFALITDFGFDGPYRDYRGNGFVDFAAGSYLTLFGDPDREPMRGPEFQPYFHTGLHAFHAAMAALLERRRSGRGQRVSASVMQALASITEWNTIRYTHAGVIQKRAGNRTALYHAYATYPCRDGHMAVCIHDAERANLIIAAGGHPERVGDPKFESDISRGVHSEEFDSLFVPWMMSTPNEELLEEFERLRIVAGPVRTIAEAFDDPFMADRQIWTQREVDGKCIRIPEPVARGRLVAEQPAQTPPVDVNHGVDGGGPLAGFRVLDLTRHWAGPIGVRPLADLGAEVIRVEAPWERGTVPPDEEFVRNSNVYMNNDPTDRYWVTSGPYNKYNHNKKAVAIRLKDAEGLAAFKRIVASADIIIDNYATQTFEAFGLDADTVLKLNPNLVSVSMSGFGREGAFKYRGAFGPASEAFVGISSLMGYPDRGPHQAGQSFPDPASGLLASSHALVGLWWRGRSGGGLQFDNEQIRSAIAFIGPEFVRYARYGEVTPRLGCRSERYAPQNAYRASGFDRWVAISVENTEQWLALLGVIGRPDLDRPALRTLDGRRKAHDEIDSAIDAWTYRRPAKVAARDLQAAGVPAFPAIDARDVAEEVYFWDTGVLRNIDGEPLTGSLFQLSRTPTAVYRNVPDVGEHNAEVLRSVGYTDAEIASLLERGIIADRPTL